MNSQRKLELSRLLSQLDRLRPDEPTPEIMNGQPIGRAFRIGITGPVGVGKSTLINQIVKTLRQQGLTIGIIAIDPSSPFTGGAVLGDRVRMTNHALDDGIFIRSFATRGAFGGLAAGAVDAADVLDAFGFDRIVIETVGVGQTEVDIMGACDATVVVFEPASGDSVQAIKAGLMEIADLFVVNKGDLKGADRFMADLEIAIELKAREPKPGVLTTVARSGDGIRELCDWLEEYYKHNTGNGKLHERRAGQRIIRIRRIVESITLKCLWRSVPTDELEKIAASVLPVREAAQAIAENFASVK